ncbi:MAG: hypothetical protein HY459_00115 [Parcubacteria group bacterium]|nr:hypothetical protein [Parcubacteria group bacterium]
MQMNDEAKAKVQMHLEEHQEYPAAKADLVAACNSLSDFSDDEKRWFAQTLPERTYNSAQDVMSALRM